MLKAKSESEQWRLAKTIEYIEFDDTWLNKFRFIQKVKSGKYLISNKSQTGAYLNDGVRDTLEEAL
jgi:hypothetical protein